MEKKPVKLYSKRQITALYNNIFQQKLVNNFVNT